MNLSRVLDITQEVKESLMPIVDCEDYYFAVNLAILAGKRDFLHYDVWLQRRISDVGTPFIKALLKYIKEHIVTPIFEYQNCTPNTPEPTADQLELFKQQVLERSHLSKEKLCITIENLSTQVNQNNSLIRPETKDQIRELMAKLSEQFPPLFTPTGNSEEIDNAANEYFQRVFSAEPHLVDQKIAELIEIMQKFRNSE
jgi:CCR4-NOT transcription complex subunit 1